MPNKPVNHNELDNAVKNILLNNQVKPRLEWEDIERLLPKKTSVVKGPIPEFDFSINTFAGAASATSAAKLKSLLLLTKRWSTALYVTAGGIVVIVGITLLYNSFSDTPAPETSATPAITQKPVKDDTVESTPAATLNNNATQQDSISDKEIDALLNSPESTLAKADKSLKSRTAEHEPAKAKSDNLSSDDNTYNDSTLQNDYLLRVDTANGAVLQRGSNRKGNKVLYYKESLTLDKLGQQTEKRDSAQAKPAITDSSAHKGGLFKKLLRHRSKEK